MIVSAKQSIGAARGAALIDVSRHVSWLTCLGGEFVTVGQTSAGWPWGAS
jgi:hypothetical protein